MTAAPSRLHPEDIAAIADAVAERLRSSAASSTAGLVDVAEVARRFGVSRDYVYDNADRLGVIRIGTGARPRLRFDPAIVAERLTRCSDSRESEQRKPASRAKPRTTGGTNGQNGPRFLPIGASEGSR
ncbi:MAG TPA: hypothetical protein VJU14_10855 [Solirubrobacterales bacterium]|nr:hypothetical protein [Solirubrobacterales bacterium]